MTVFDTTTEEGRSLKTLWALDEAFGRSPSGPATHEPSPVSRSRPSRVSVRNAENDQ